MKQKEKIDAIKRIGKTLQQMHTNKTTTVLFNPDLNQLIFTESDDNTLLSLATTTHICRQHGYRNILRGTGPGMARGQRHILRAILNNPSIADAISLMTDWLETYSQRTDLEIENQVLTAACLAMIAIKNNTHDKHVKLHRLLIISSYSPPVLALMLSYVALGIGDYVSAKKYIDDITAHLKITPGHHKAIYISPKYGVHGIAIKAWRPLVFSHQRFDLLPFVIQDLTAEEATICLNQILDLLRTHCDTIPPHNLEPFNIDFNTNLNLNFEQVSDALTALSRHPAFNLIDDINDFLKAIDARNKHNCFKNTCYSIKALLIFADKLTPSAVEDCYEILIRIFNEPDKVKHTKEKDRYFAASIICKVLPKVSPAKKFYLGYHVREKLFDSMDDSKTHEEYIKITSMLFSETELQELIKQITETYCKVTADVSALHLVFAYTKLQLLAPHIKIDSQIKAIYQAIINGLNNALSDIKLISLKILSNIFPKLHLSEIFYITPHILEIFERGYDVKTIKELHNLTVDVLIIFVKRGKQKARTKDENDAWLTYTKSLYIELVKTRIMYSAKYRLLTELYQMLQDNNKTTSDLSDEINKFIKENDENIKNDLESRDIDRIIPVANILIGCIPFLDAKFLNNLADILINLYKRLTRDVARPDFSLDILLCEILPKIDEEPRNRIINSCYFMALIPALAKHPDFINEAFANNHCNYLLDRLIDYFENEALPYTNFKNMMKCFQAMLPKVSTECRVACIDTLIYRCSNNSFETDKIIAAQILSQIAFTAELPIKSNVNNVLKSLLTSLPPADMDQQLNQTIIACINNNLYFITEIADKIINNDGSVKFNFEQLLAHLATVETVIGKIDNPATNKLRELAEKQHRPVISPAA